MGLKEKGIVMKRKEKKVYKGIKKKNENKRKQTKECKV